MEQSIQWFDNHNVAMGINAAEKYKKAILIDFFSTTCLGCAKMLKRTYADAGVQQLIDVSFVAIKFDTSGDRDQLKLLSGGAVHVWHPHLLITSHQFADARHLIGYLSPDSMIANLRIGLGLLDLHYGRFVDARRQFALATHGRLPDEVIAEALYWLGIAEYREADELDALKAVWSKLRHRFPNSDWADRADCLDVLIPEDGFDARDPRTVEIIAQHAQLRVASGGAR
jgi:hypothetical protein